MHGPKSAAELTESLSRLRERDASHLADGLLTTLVECDSLCTLREPPAERNAPSRYGTLRPITAFACAILSWSCSCLFVFDLRLESAFRTIPAAFRSWRIALLTRPAELARLCTSGPYSFETSFRRCFTSLTIFLTSSTSSLSSFNVRTSPTTPSRRPSAFSKCFDTEASEISYTVAETVRPESTQVDSLTHYDIIELADNQKTTGNPVVSECPRKDLNLQPTD